MSPLALADAGTAALLLDLQSLGLRLEDSDVGITGRRGGAGPSDHKAVNFAGRTVMIPIATASACESPFVASRPDQHGISVIRRDGIEVSHIEFPRQTWQIIYVRKMINESVLMRGRDGHRIPYFLDNNYIDFFNYAHDRRASIGVAVLRRMLAFKHSAHDATANAPYKTSQILDGFEFHGGGFSRFAAPSTGGFERLSPSRP